MSRLLPRPRRPSTERLWPASGSKLARCSSRGPGHALRPPTLPARLGVTSRRNFPAPLPRFETLVSRLARVLGKLPQRALLLQKNSGSSLRGLLGCGLRVGALLWKYSGPHCGASLGLVPGSARSSEKLGAFLRLGPYPGRSSGNIRGPPYTTCLGSCPVGSSSVFARVAEMR